MYINQASLCGMNIFYNLSINVYVRLLSIPNDLIEQVLEAQLFSNYICTVHVTGSLCRTDTHGTFSYIGHIYVVCGSILTFFTGLPPTKAIYDG